MTPIISLTTTPVRIDLIEPVIESLKTQGLPIYLWIPEYCKRMKITFNGKIPKFLKDVNVEIIEDLGPITKLLPALKAGFETIITADDDRFYYDGWAKNLLWWSEKVWYGSLHGKGRMVQYPRYRLDIGTAIQNVEKPTEVDVGEGAFGSVYRNGFFDEEIFTDYEKYFFNDDIAISLHLAKQGIKRLVIPHKEPHPLGLIGKNSPLASKNFGIYNLKYLREGEAAKTFISLRSMR
jgi:hypothetical protein